MPRKNAAVAYTAPKCDDPFGCINEELAAQKSADKVEHGRCPAYRVGPPWSTSARRGQHYNTRCVWRFPPQCSAEHPPSVQDWRVAGPPRLCASGPRGGRGGAAVRRSLRQSLRLVRARTGRDTKYEVNVRREVRRRKKHELVGFSYVVPTTLGFSSSSSAATPTMNGRRIRPHARCPQQQRGRRRRREHRRAVANEVLRLPPPRKMEQGPRRCIPHLTWVDARPVLHQLPHGLDVPVGHRLGVGELLGEAKGDADLGGSEVGVGGDDGAAGVVDPLAHHVLAEEALLLLQHLHASREGEGKTRRRV